MQITTTKESLASPLALVAGAADTRGTVPMLGAVLLKTTDAGKLSMICSSTGMLAKAQIPVEVKQSGEIAVDVRRINELVRALPEKQPIEISIESDKGTLLVKSGRSRFRLPAFAASAYPRMTPAKEERISITMSAHRLADMIADVTPSIADADVRVFLNGALFTLDNVGLFIVSTDGHRMTVSHEPITGADTLVPRNVIVPRKTVQLAKKLLGQGGNVTLTLGSKNVQFTFEDGTVLFGNSVDGQFPAWKNVIPASTERVIVSADRLAASLTMLAAAQDDKAKQDVMKTKVEISFTKATTTLRRGDAGLCELDSVSSSDVPHELAFNINYLSDAVATIRSTSEEAVIGYSPSATAITIRPKGKDYPLTVVMPIRV
ncbi:DNA polymerase III subunit beta [Sulfuricystis multivorans]|uniref:DNA polymerase III subunit beta n=1 Tax=Sulfuricystis multivorans TaxID=2211108 RepID=UPI000F82F7A9|nr:DNA polymerase III subunit beta [Sulfuricystis multivorans]